MSFCLTKITSFSPSLCSSVFKKTSVSLCHYVILSSKKHLSLSVTLSFCLQKNICLSLSLCHSVFKKTSVSFRPSVILSSRPPLLSLLSSCYSVFKKHLSLFLIMSLCGRQRIQNLDKTVQKKQKRGCVIIDTPSFVMLLPRRGNQFSASFLFLSSICDVFYSNVHISCNNLCITLEVFSVVPLQITFKSPYRRQS